MGEGFPLCSLAPMAWEEQEPLRDWICLSFSLCSVFCSAALSPFRIYMEILNSDWYLRRDFLPKISFLAAEEGHQPPYGWPTRVLGMPRGRARPLSRGHLGHRFALILLPIFSKYSKNILRPFYPVWIPFDMGFLRNIKHATNRNRNWH